MKAFLRWWLMFCLLGIGTYATHKFGMFVALNDADASKLSFVILSLFTIFTIYIGMLTQRTMKERPPTDPQWNTCWFFADSLVTLGMIGTVIGFLMMLGLAFANLNVSEVASVQEAIKTMALGMSTALVTTLVGMAGGWLLKLQLLNLENGVAEHESKTQNEPTLSSLLSEDTQEAVTETPDEEGLANVEQVATQ